VQPVDRISRTDAALLATLERAFAHHAGGDARIDLDELKVALGLKSNHLARRVMACFDANGDGVISKDEFLAGVRALLVGTDREKLRFAFRLHDENGDGFIDREELFRMIAVSLAESDVAERVTQPPAQLAAALLKTADKDGDGRLSFEELEAVVRGRPELLARMTRSEAIWIAPNEELLVLFDERAKARPGRVARFLENSGLEVAFIALWIAANAGVFAYSMLLGRASHTTDPAMQIGRALGANIDLNGALVFVPMMRRLLTWVRSTWLGRVVPVDESITFHKTVGHALFALAVTHSTAFLVAYAGGHAPSGSPLRLFETERGLTGGILLGVFAVMWIFSLGFIRRSARFELFYFTHLLYLAWLGLAIAHAPRFLVFAGVPILGFVVEQILRLRRRAPSSGTLSTWPLRSGVTRIEIAKPQGFTFNAGDYAFLRIPGIARHEWHPFTISSAPEQPTLTFHVRSLGNWTAALRRHAEAGRETAALQTFIDGPYGSPTQHIFASRVAVLIGAGIGVTPFASVLESVVLQSNAPTAERTSKLEWVHFFWLNRDAYSFEWFRALLSKLEELDKRHLLYIHLCMTGARTGVTAFGLELAREIMHASGRSDIITGLRTKTHMGHPDWDAMLGEIKRMHEGQKVDVFFCGPRGLAKKLRPLCEHMGMSFREERF
jgi:Ca2+-binding EF-hand superfamily protein/NAD(P)H-flavin reductase